MSSSDRTILTTLSQNNQPDAHELESKRQEFSAEFQSAQDTLQTSRISIEAAQVWLMAEQEKMMKKNGIFFDAYIRYCMDGGTHLYTAPITEFCKNIKDIQKEMPDDNTHRNIYLIVNVETTHWSLVHIELTKAKATYEIIDAYQHICVSEMRSALEKELGVDQGITLTCPQNERIQTDTGCLMFAVHMAKQIALLDHFHDHLKKYANLNEDGEFVAPFTALPPQMYWVAQSLNTAIRVYVERNDTNTLTVPANAKGESLLSRVGDYGTTIDLEDIGKGVTRVNNCIKNKTRRLTGEGMEACKVMTSVPKPESILPLDHDKYLAKSQEAKDKCGHAPPAAFNIWPAPRQATPYDAQKNVLALIDKLNTQDETTAIVLDIYIKEINRLCSDSQILAINSLPTKEPSLLLEKKFFVERYKDIEQTYGTEIRACAQNALHNVEKSDSVYLAAVKFNKSMDGIVKARENACHQKYGEGSEIHVQLSRLMMELEAAAQNLQHEPLRAILFLPNSTVPVCIDKDTFFMLNIISRVANALAVPFDAKTISETSLDSVKKACQEKLGLAQTSPRPH